jgi:hypothetical protein
MVWWENNSRIALESNKINVFFLLFKGGCELNVWVYFMTIKVSKYELTLMKCNILLKK